MTDKLMITWPQLRIISPILQDSRLLARSVERLFDDSGFMESILACN